ncbi:MAG: flippase-like domain-containing protein, partial [Deltaproteobacteria bacterium]|nr:flippase-like domain-containing protein [Deltaproteobacteria bacterium]
PLWLAVSFALVFANFAVAARSWAPVFRALDGRPIRLAQAFAIIYSAQLARYLPGRVWQFVGQAEAARRMGFAASTALSASFTQIIAGTAAGLVVAAVCAYASGEVAMALAALAGGFTVLAGLLLSGRFADRIAKRLPAHWRLSQVRFDVGTRGFCEVFAWGILGWVFHVGAVVALWAAIAPTDVDIAWRVASSYVFSYLFAFYTLVTPAGLGVREGAVTALLGPAMGAGPAGMLAIVQRIWFTVCESVAFVVAAWLWRSAARSDKKPG